MEPNFHSAQLAGRPTAPLRLPLRRGRPPALQLHVLSDSRLDEVRYHGTFRLYKIVRATRPLFARPIETVTGIARPGTSTLRTRIE